MAMFENQATSPNAPNPQGVTDAIFHLVEGINRTIDQVQSQALGAMGMSVLLTPNVAKKTG